MNDAAERMALFKIDTAPDEFKELVKLYGKKYVASMIGVYGDRAVHMANKCIVDWKENNE